MVYVLIDSPLGPYSTEVAVRRWRDYVLRMVEAAGDDEARQQWREELMRVDRMLGIDAGKS